MAGFSIIDSTERRIVHMTAARRRWCMLAEVIVSSRTTSGYDNCIHSVRRFTSFGLFHIQPTNETFQAPNSYDYVDGKSSPSLAKHSLHLHENAANDVKNWFEYTLPSLMDDPLYIRHVTQKLCPETLLGFNNTGNVCVWASEEVMSYFCLTNKNTFQDKTICELGGGMTCLAGMSIAKSVETKEMLLTDGNEDAVTNIARIITANRDYIKSQKISSKCVRWPVAGDIAHLHGHFDFIICADCLFFDDGRVDLVDTMDKLLAPTGEVIIFAPTRGYTLDAFVQLASRIFSVRITRHYSDHVSHLHSMMKEKGLETYDEDIHYPLLIQMTKNI